MQYATVLSQCANRAMRTHVSPCMYEIVRVSVCQDETDTHMQESTCYWHTI